MSCHALKNLSPSQQELFDYKPDLKLLDGKNQNLPGFIVLVSGGKTPSAGKSVWGGEFGRTPIRENRGGKEMALIARDHNPGAFTMWLAGGGIKRGMTFGASDEIGYDAVENRVSPHDLQATLLHALRIDHKRLTYSHQGLPQRLSNVTQPSRVVKEIFA